MSLMKKIQLLGYGWSMVALLLAMLAMVQLADESLFIRHAITGGGVTPSLLLHVWLRVMWRGFELVGWCLLLVRLRISILILGSSALIWLVVTVVGFFPCSGIFAPFGGFFDAVALIVYAVFLMRLVMLYKSGGYRNTPTEQERPLRRPAKFEGRR